MLHPIQEPLRSACCVKTALSPAEPALCPSALRQQVFYALAPSVRTGGRFLGGDVLYPLQVYGSELIQEVASCPAKRTFFVIVWYLIAACAA